MKLKKNVSLTSRRIAIAVGAALASLAAAPAVANDPLLTIKLFRDSDVMFRDADMSRWADNYLELGVGYNSSDSLRFGQFSNLVNQGGFPLAGFNYISRDAGNDAQYWRVHGANLGLGSRKLSAEGGIQGKWNLSFSLDQLQKSQTETASFYHNGLGSSTLTLPNATTFANPTLIPAANLRAFDIDHGRDIYRVGLNGLLSRDWDFKINYREDQRDGTRMTGYIFSNGSSAIVPYQIEDKTQQVDATLSYNTKQAQLQFGYTYSRFTNQLSSFLVQSPFTGANLNNRMSLAPSNDFHQVNLTGAYNFSKVTRLKVAGSHGISLQNEAFLPYSVNGAAANAPLPRSSLDGKVVSTLLDVALTTKPIDKMNLKVAYQYRASDNRTPTGQYAYASRDAAAVATAGGAAGSAAVRSNAPISTTENKLSLEGDYEIGAKTILRAGLERTRKEYTKADRGTMDTDKLSLELRKPVADEFLANAGYTFTRRRGSDYDKNTFFRNTYTDPVWQTNPNNGSLTNHPSMRPFMFQDYDEHRVRGGGSWTVSETVQLQGNIDRYDQRAKDTGCNIIADPNVQAAINKNVADPALKLPDTCLGRKLADGNTLNIDAQWQPEEELTTFAFYNFNETRTKQAGRTWRTDNAGGADESATAADTRRDWSGDIRNRDHAIGLGLKYQPHELWDTGGTYVYSSGRGKYDIKQSAAPAVAGGGGNASALLDSLPVPDTWSRLHTLQLFAKWEYSKKLTWRFNYLYENLRSYDWALSDVAATSNPNVLFTGAQAPRSSNHVFGVSAVIKSW